uniref:Uncharacterized protein n=1 Tax=Arundo donax TaxID=35708 RepID=A0A0A9AA96_ARUDO
MDLIPRFSLSSP